MLPNIPALNKLFVFRASLLLGMAAEDLGTDFDAPLFDLAAETNTDAENIKKITKNENGFMVSSQIR